MIDEKRLVELREKFAKGTVYAPEQYELFDTMAALLKIARAAMEMDRLLCFSDKIYDVREREGEGWDGPKVIAYSNVLREFHGEIKNLPAVEDKEPERP